MSYLQGLKDRLDNAERALELSKFIDDTQRMIRERDHFEGVVKFLRGRIETLEADKKEIIG